jgi:hypothetical protein
MRPQVESGEKARWLNRVRKRVSKEVDRDRASKTLRAMRKALCFILRLF